MADLCWHGWTQSRSLVFLFNRAQYLQSTVEARADHGPGGENDPSGGSLPANVPPGRVAFSEDRRVSSLTIPHWNKAEPVKVSGDKRHSGDNVRELAVQRSRRAEYGVAIESDKTSAFLPPCLCGALLAWHGRARGRNFAWLRNPW